MGIAVSWRFAGIEPRELRSHGFDATVYEWSLENEITQARATSSVFISGSAMASDGVLPQVVAEAKASRGRSVVAQFLDWAVPPRKFELDTSTERPRLSGGVRAASEAEGGDLQSITEWFSERNIDLEIEQRGNYWTAIMLPRGVRIGSADYGRGVSALEAAEDAKQRFEVSEQARERQAL